MSPLRRPSRPIWIFIAGLAVLVATLACSLFTAERAPTPTETSAAIATEMPTPTEIHQPTSTPPPTPTEPPPPTATEPSGEGQVEVLETSYSEDFSSSADHWQIGEEDDPVAKLSYELDDSQYVWEAEAFDDMAWLQIADPVVPLPEGDYLYTASLEMQAEQDELAAGILFNCQDLDNLYFAKLSSNGEVAAYILFNNQWQVLVEPTTADAFQNKESNRLSVAKRGDEFEIQVNDTPVATFSDDRLPGGTIGLAIEMQAGERGRFIFDDLRVMRGGGSAAGREEPRPTIIAMGASLETFEGQAGSVAYFLDYPRSFVHSTSGGWQRFCLDAPEELCVSVQAHESFQGDENALADEVITGFSSAVSDYTELHRQSTQTNQGLPAVFVGYTYARGGVVREGARLFVVAQGVGFDIAAEGEPVMVDVYRTILNNVLESFRVRQ